MRQFFLFLLSFVLVAIGIPAFASFLSPISALIGYGLFFAFFLKNRRLFVAGIFGFFVELVHLSFMTSITYQGIAFLAVYLILSFLLALEFVLFCYFLKQRPLTLFRMAFLASFWTLLEWSRLYFLCGYTWNPVGLTLVSYPISMQIASLVGVYGLSFLVIFTNLLGCKALFLEKTKKNIYIWIGVALFPYFFGAIYMHSFVKTKESTHVLLVQTALYPEEKEPLDGYYSSFVPPLVQWERIFSLITSQKIENSIDLIVLPETAVPFRASTYLYPLREVKRSFIKAFSDTIEPFFAPLQEPYAKIVKEDYYVSNLFLAKTLSSFYSAELILGLDDLENKNYYNSAFFLSPNSDRVERYDKQILVPIAEYFPFAFCKKIAEGFGIAAPFLAGCENKVFGNNGSCVSICYEETFGHLFLKAKKEAKLFVNLSNDGWFPHSKLPWQHFYHARLRSVEMGLPMVRACNTSITAGLDCFGNIVDGLYKEEEAKALFVEIPKDTHKTLYSYLGNGFIVSISLFFVVGTFALFLLRVLLRGSWSEQRELQKPL